MGERDFICCSFVTAVVALSEPFPIVDFMNLHIAIGMPESEEIERKL